MSSRICGDFSYIPITSFGREGEVDVLAVAIETTNQEDMEVARGELAAIYANAPLALLVVNQELRVQDGNNLAARFAGLELADLPGLSPCEALGCRNSLAYSCGRGPSCGKCPLCLAIIDTLTNGAPHDGIETWSSSKPGQSEQRCLQVSTTALTFQRARKTLVCAQDITERKKLEAELIRRQEESDRQSALLNFSHDSIVTCNVNWVITGWNRGAEELYGWREAEAVGANLYVLLGSNSLSSDLKHGDWLLDRNRWEGELEHRSRGNKPILVDSRQIVLSSVGDIRILVIDRDITLRRNAEDTIREALAERTVLLQEIHHRVKNSLAVTASLLSMKADGSPPEAKLALEESQQRVHSIALVHEHLYASNRLDRIDFGEYARELAEGVFATFACKNGNVRLHLELDPIDVAIQRAAPCALILNELLTNAFKYAFEDGRAGRIMVSLSQPEAGQCELAVQDDGVGLHARCPWRSK
jgi:PAS domain S-box-containing protein